MRPLLLTERGERLLRHLAAEHAAHRDPSSADLNRALRFGSGNVLDVQIELVRTGCAFWTLVMVGRRSSRRLRLAPLGQDAAAGRVPIGRKTNTMWKSVQ
jgi:hypothetical protein